MIGALHKTKKISLQSSDYCLNVLNAYNENALLPQLISLTNWCENPLLFIKSALKINLDFILTKVTNSFKCVFVVTFFVQFLPRLDF